MSPLTSSDSSISKYDISITDENGEVMVVFKGFSTRVWKPDLSHTVSDVKGSDLFYTIPDWKECPVLDISSQSESFNENVVVVIEAIQSLREAISKNYDKAEVIALSEGTEVMAQDIYTDFIKVFEVIKTKAQIKERFSVIILLSDRREGYFYAALSGLMKTACMEHTYMQGKIITYSDFSSNNLNGLVALIRTELDSLEDNYIEVHYGEDLKQRYVKVISEVSLPEHKNNASSLLKAGGVYWITGGLGGLGRIFAKYMATLERSVVVLSGRSTLDEKKRAQLEELRMDSTMIDYCRCDVSLSDEVGKTVDYIRERYGKLDGIIHASGIINDALIANKTVVQIEEVLTPKIKGVLNLDAATQTLPLDFFILFSSTAAVTGNIGQSDYAGANTFLDSFGLYRQGLVSSGKCSGTTISINWAYWQSEGMSINEATIEHMANHYGTYPMPEEKGMEAFKKIMASRITGVGVWYGKVEKIKNILIKEQKDEIFGNVIQGTHDADENSSETLEPGLKEKALLYFKRLLGAVTQSPVEQIRADEKLEKYGLDSLKIIELINELEKIFGSLSRTLFFEYQSIEQITDYFIRDHRDTLAKVLGKPSESSRVKQTYKRDKSEKMKEIVSGKKHRFVKHITESKEQETDEALAIVGMACRFPDANNPSIFWNNLKQGRNSIKKVPLERWDNERIYDPEFGKWGKSTIRWGSFIDDIDKFDPLFFRIPVKEAELMAPELRLFLQTGWECLEDGGYSLDTIKQKYKGNVGVFAGVMDEYYHLFAHQAMMSKPAPMAGSLSADVANQFSYFCGFTGPSVALNTMSTSLSVGIHYAQQCLFRGDCQMALVGGVNLIYHPWKNMGLSLGGFTTPDDNVVRSFGKGANGTIVGEGVAAFLIKTLRQAKEDNDNIYGVIKGIAVNSAGERNGYIAPNPDNQAEAIKRALEQAKIHPRTITYVEAHATATKLGDPVEVLSLTKGFRKYTQDKQYCAIGCVKSNIGHLEPASGAPGLMKILLQFKYGQIVKSLHSEQLNPDIDFENTPFFVPQELTQWKHPKINLDGEEKTYPLRACFSSISAGGVNAEIILEEYISKDSQANSLSKIEPYLFIFSALKQERLKEYLKRMITFLNEQDMLIGSEGWGQLKRLAYTLQVGRQPFKNRLAVIASSKEELLEKLIGYNNQQKNQAGVIEGTILNLDQYDIKTKLGIDDKTIAQSLSRKDLEALAHYWVKGIQINWSEYHGKEYSHRLPIPTYCFEKRRIWYPGYQQWYPNDGNIVIRVTNETTKCVADSSFVPVEKNDIDCNKTIQCEEKISSAESSNILLNQLIGEIRSTVADLLAFDVEDVDIDTNLSNFGFDSIKLTKLSQNLNKQYDLNLTPATFFEHKDLSSLVNYLLDRYRDKLNKHFNHKISHEDTENERVENKTDLNTKIIVENKRPYKGIDLIEKNVERADNQQGYQPIAVIGMAGRFPQSKNIETLWQNILQNKDLITPFPKTRGDVNYQRLIEQSNFPKWGGFLESIDTFDTGFFKISPREAELLDPQQRMLLEVSWELLESAGYSAESISGSNTGVFIGICGLDYAELLQKNGLSDNSHFTVAVSHSMAANRLSYFLNLHGPSEAIDTACSSSLVAMHRALTMLQTGQCETAIVGGVNLLITSSVFESAYKAGMLCEDGRCKTFSNRANGYVRGEGCSALLLKPLVKAQEDKDNILGVIIGSAENHGGQSNSLTAPNGSAQSILIEQALSTSKVDPSSISYIEAHGTGTELGDPIEMNALKSAFNAQYKKWGIENPLRAHCGVGSLKSNIGHLEAAAGIAGVIKVLLCLQHKYLPGLLHCEEVNPYIELEKSPFYIIKENQDWEVIEDKNGRLFPRRAGVSSFGFGGSNVHVLLEEWTGEDAQIGGGNAGVNKPCYLITLSAKSESALKRKIEDLLQWLEPETMEIDLQSVSYTLNVGRSHFEKRCCVVVDSIEELKETLKQVNQGKIPDNYLVSQSTKVAKEERSIYNKVLEGLIKELNSVDYSQSKQYRDNLLALASLYVKGYAIDWGLLHMEETHQRISLPTYPFDKERHWVEMKDTVNRLALAVELSEKSVLGCSFEDDAETPLQEVEEPFQLAFFREKWVVDESVYKGDDKTKDTALLLVGTQEDSTALRDALVKHSWLGSKGSIECLSLYDTRRRWQDSLDESLDRMIVDKTQGITIVYLAHCKDTLPAFVVEQAQENQRTFSLEEWLENGIISVYRIVRYLLNNNKKGQLRFLYVYKDEQECGVLQPMLSGFMRSVKQENPWFSGKVIGVDKGLEEMDYLADILLREQEVKQMNRLEVRYSFAKGKQERLLNRIEPIVEKVDDILQAKVEALDFSNEPVVLITGGLGGLGAIFARYLSERLKARIVLMGRSELDEGKQKQINAIEVLGGKVIYVKGDVGELEDVQKAVKAVKQHFGNIDMVIHSAGVIKDALLVNKNQEDYSSVLSPKVYGTVNLDWATRDEPLRYFILFSSLSAKLGNNKGSDYATANGFLDGYARLRNKWCIQQVRSGKSIAINWLYWEDGGMQMDNAQDYIQWMKQEQGLLPLDNDIGTQAFIKALGLNEPQILVLKGYPQKMNNLIKRENLLFEENEEEYVAQNFGIDDKQRLIQQVEKQLRELVMNLLKIKNERLSSEESLQTYGFDSITLKSLSEGISHKYRIRVLPSVFFAHETISKLSTYLVKQYTSELFEHFGMAVDTNNKSQQNIKKKMKEKVCQRTLEPSNKAYDLKVSSMDIAVIGMAGIFPGSSDLNAFWQHLDDGDDLVKEVPANRWDWKKYYGDPFKDSSKTLSKWGGFIDDYDHFDAGFFKVSGREAELMDPQHRLFLQTSWKAIEDAGYDPYTLAGSDAGVFVGIQFHEYEKFLERNNQIHAFGATGNAHSMIANRVSYVLDWHGPSESIDTACSSSLVAIHRAVLALKTGECSVALAGGVSLNLDPESTVGASQLGVLSPDGRCKSFGQGANGYVRGEGVGIVLLKPLSQAQQDADIIYGVIRASAVAHGGKANSLTAPNSLAQSQLLIKAYQQAGITAERIGYIEAHATGTELGDPVEVEGLKTAFEQLSVKNSSNVKSNYCGLGSVKTNIGHLEPAAGIAGVLKVLLALKYKKLPRSLHSEEVNAYLELNESPFYVVGQKRVWEAFKDDKGEEQARVAGVSSFGFGGAYAHVVLEEWTGGDPEVNRENTRVNKPCYLIALSAKSENVLTRKVEDLLQWLESEGMQSDLESISYTLNMGRSHFDKRCCVVASSASELKDTLQQINQGKDPENYLLSKSTKVAKDEEAIYKQVLKGLIDELKVIDYTDAGRYRDRLWALAGLYVKGYNIDWYLIHQNEGCKRISLPTYPFVNKRYWVEGEVSVVENKAWQINKHLHPLVHENASTLEQQIFISRLTSKMFFLEDHRVQGKCVLPGVAYLEMARAASELAAKDKVIRIANVVWARPIVVDEMFVGKEGKKVIEIGLAPQEDGILYEVRLGSTEEEEQEKGVLYAQGKIFLQDREASNKENVWDRIDLDKIRQRCVSSMDIQEMYDAFQQQGLDYGESFQVVKELWGNDNEALGWLQLPKCVSHMFEDFVLHPSLMDGALQCLVGIAHTKEIQKELSLPFALESLEIIAPLMQECFAYVSKDKRKVVGSNTVEKFTVTLTDNFGKVLVVMKGFSARVVKKGENGDEIVNKTKNAMLFFEPIFEQKVLRVQTQKAFSGAVLMIDDSNPSAEALQKAFGTQRWQANQLIRVKAGETFELIEENVYRLDVREGKDFEKLFQVLKEDGKKINTIIYAVDRICTEKVSQNTENKAKGIKRGLEVLLCIAQAWVSQRTKDKIKIVCLNRYRGIQDSRVAGALCGFLQTLVQEHSCFECKVVEFDETEQDEAQTNDMSSWISQELLVFNSKVEYLRYQAGRRLGLMYKEVAENNLMLKEPIFAKDGIYVITGGLGGLGIIFARYLLEGGASKVALLGRSELDEHKQETLNRLNDLGEGEVLYVKGDVSDVKRLAVILKEMKQKTGRIKGVVHSAGVLCDERIVKKKLTQLEEVLRPKIDATLLLDESTKQEPLEWFVLFSSVAAVLGNIGQCDYAFANGFMDDFAEWRQRLVDKGERNGKTVSINWPLWQEGGMQIDEATELLMRSTAGLNVLSTQQGLAAMGYALSHSAVQLVVFSGKPYKLRALFGDSSISSMASEEPQHDDVERYEQIEDVVAKGFEKDLRKSLANLLKLEADEIDQEEQFSEYGMDSISLTQWANKLNDIFGMELTPTTFFENFTLGGLQTYLLENYKQSLNKRYGLDKQEKGIERVELVKSIKASVKQRFVKGKVAASLYENDSKDKLKINNQAIAIVGMNGVLPDSPTLEVFWGNLVANKDLISEVAMERWDWRRYEQEGDNQKIYCRWGGFVDGIDEFDASFFGISPREAESMDPQQRLFLQSAWHTIEDAGYNANDLAGSNTGVFMGVASSDYAQLLNQSGVEMQGHSSTGIAHSILANRLSYLLDLHGPSEPIDTACSSSLVAIHRAVQAIRLGNCDQAIVGGVNALLSVEGFIAFSRAGMLSEDGRCKTFDKSANGYVRGEGVGTLLLKRLSNALNDRDHIYGLIKGSAENHGGRANSLTAPNPGSQAQLLVKAYEDAGISADRIGYIEAHGTGTQLGDPVEVDGLKGAFKQLYVNKGIQETNKGYCALGSVKSNIGHLETAAGIAGILKVLLALKYKKLPGQVHFKEENEHLKLNESPFYVVEQTQAWEAFRDDKGEEQARVAGVSSFGFGGANAHVVLEEWTGENAKSSIKNAGVNKPCYLIALSAKSEGSLKRRVEDLLQCLKAGGIEINLQALSYTSNVGRTHFEKRCCLVISSIDELKKKLEQVTQGKSPSNYLEGKSTKVAKEEQVVYGQVLQGLINELENIDYTDANHYRDKLLALAGLYVKGYTIDWQLLHQGEERQRISLPTYPFEKKRCWIGSRSVQSGIQKLSLKGAQTSDIVSRLSSAKQSDVSTVILNQNKYFKPSNAVSFTAIKQSPKKKNDMVAPIADLEVKIKGIFQDLLYLSDEELNPKKSFSEIGVDSILAVDIAKRINEEMSTDLQSKHFYNYPTIEKLAQYIGCSSQRQVTDSSLKQEIFESELAERSIIASVLKKDIQLQNKQYTDNEVVSSECSIKKNNLEQIKNFIKVQLKNLLYLEEEEVIEEKSFKDFGIDSILGVEFTKLINQGLRVRIEAPQLYEHPTLVRLAEYIYRKQKSEREEKAQTGQKQGEATISKKVIFPFPSRKKTLIKINKQSDTLKICRNSGSDNFDIAIIGMSGKFPEADNTKVFWDNLKNGINSIQQIPSDRWAVDGNNAVGPLAAYKNSSKWGGFIKDIDKFDPLFFNISPREAISLSPEERLFMEVVWSTMEDAGYNLRQLESIQNRYKQGVGVFAGAMYRQYPFLIEDRDLRASLSVSSYWSIVNRVSYFFNLKGPSLAIDTACSSSMTAVHLACESLRRGECCMALVGGVNLTLHPSKYWGLAQAGMLGSGDKSKSLGQGDGLIPGEGCCAVLMKPLSRAIEDHDYIYGVIKSSGINHGGKGSGTGLSVPQTDQQSMLISQVIERAKVNIRTVNYIEVAANGISLADVSEMRALNKAFSNFTDEKNYCALGAVKSNIGHLEAASGISQLIKVLLQLKHRQLVPTLNAEPLNPEIKLEDTPFYLQKKFALWNRVKLEEEEEVKEYPLRAGISSFGAGGSNAHLILEEAPTIEKKDKQKKNNVREKSHLIILSARKEKSLKDGVKNLYEELKNGAWKNVSLDDIAHTLQIGREEMEWRLAIVAKDNETLVERLSGYLKGDIENEDLFTGLVELPSNQAQENMLTLPGGEFLEFSLGKNTLKKLGKLWVKGTFIDWRKLYEKPYPYKLPLPTYSFEKKRFWLSDPPLLVNTHSNNDHNHGRSHIIEGSLETLSFNKDLSLDKTSSPCTKASNTKIIEKELRVILSGFIDLDKGSIDSKKRFNEYGLDSILMARYMQQVQEQLGDWVALSAASQYPNIKMLAGYLSEQATQSDIMIDKRVSSITASTKDKNKKVKSLPEELIPLNPYGGQRTSFWVHGGFGFTQVFNKLSVSLGKDYPLYAFQARGFDGKKIPFVSLEEMAHYYIECMKQVQPQGPYIIGGYSFGGLVAYEMAHQLNITNEKVEQVIMLDTLPPVSQIIKPNFKAIKPIKEVMIANLFLNMEIGSTEFITSNDVEGIAKQFQLIHLVELIKQRSTTSLSKEELHLFIRGAMAVMDCCEEQIDGYKLKKSQAEKVTYFKATQGFFGGNNFLGIKDIKFRVKDYTKPWKKWIGDKLEIIPCPGNHFNLLDEPSLSILRERLVKLLKAVDQK